MTSGKTLCLNMIVRNEMANLERCLGALADHIDCWVIGDTGSTDGTQDFIKSFFASRQKSGELHSFPFKNFEQARNAALDFAYASKLAYDYLLLADADMELVVEDKTFRDRLEEPGYRLLQRAESGLAYWNTRVVQRNAGARYYGVTHEYIHVPGGVKELQGVWYKDHASGPNRVDKFERDIKLLSEALEQDPENHRYWFYLAQSYRDAGRTAEAAKAYAKRAEMGGWDEEAWNARLQEARCLRKLGDEGGFVRQALAAFNMRPQRAEPLYDLARFYREKGMNDASVLFSEAGLATKRPEQDILFLEDFAYTTGLQEEYSIAANYARDPERKNRGFAACNWLALNRAVPDASRELAWSNLFFYVEPASAILPSFAARPVGFTPPDGCRPLNPSVTRLDQQIVIMQRTVNHRLTEDGLQYDTPNNGPIHTRNFLLRLAHDLDIQSAMEILPPADMPEPASKLVLGFEDLRLFSWGGELWGCACVRELTPEAWCEQVLARIGEFGPETCRLTDWRVLRPEGPRVHEKNWMPQVAGDRLQFIYLCDPTRVVDDRGRTVTETTPSIAAQRFRGGSQLIAFDGGWLALIHEVQRRPSDRRRYYQHRFVWFDETNTLRRVSRPFFFRKKGVEFAAGMAWHPDGKRLLISYSVADSEAWIATVDAVEVRAVLEDAERLPSGSSARVPDAPVNLPKPKNRPDGTIVQTTINGERISFFVTNRDDSIMKFHHQGVFYETEELDLIKRHYSQGGTFVDIGANIGNHAVYISRFTKSSRIIVFEPNQTAVSILKENLLLNQCNNVDTRFLGIALGAKKSRLRQSTPDANNLGHTFYIEDESGDIQAIDGDALILDEPVEFIKIDVEGMEIEILSGLQQTIRRWRPTIFIEVWDSRAQAFLDWCAGESYSIVDQFQRYEGIRNYLVKPTASITTENGAWRRGVDPATASLAAQGQLLVGGIGDESKAAKSTEETFAARAPRAPRRLKIAVYTIALDEAHHVDRWRSSASDADYLVVADTGSTDDTVERLCAAGVQVHRIAIRPWRFDDARNASLALVPADADVCISLDMDEFMMPDWRTVVESAWTPGVTRLSYNFAPDYRGPGTPAHLIRKSKIHARWGYRWKRIIHEDLQPTDANEKQIAIDAPLIGQMQDLSKDRGKYLPMLQRAHEEDPNDSQICFWFARDLMYAGLNERSAEKYQAYLALPTSTWPDERSEAMRFLARVEPHRKREWLQKSVAEAPHRRKLWLDLAEFFHAELNWLDLFWACMNGIERTRRTGSYLDEPAAWGYRLYDLGALACSHLGLIDQAIKWGSTALDLVPNDQRLANNLAYYRSQALRRPA